MSVIYNIYSKILNRARIIILDINIKDKDIIIRIIYYIILIINLYISLYIIMRYNNNNIESQFRYMIDIYYTYIIIGIDGINIPLIMITVIIIPTIGYIRERYNREGINMIKNLIIIEYILIIIFIVKDIFIFYTMYELILIPMFIIIIKYGSRYKKYEAAYRFYIYTFTGSILFIIGIIIMMIKYGTTNNEILELEMNTESRIFKIIIWILIFFSFAIKIPMLPFHLWLPEAHTEAPTSGSVLLAAILLKLGIFGFLRYSINILGDVNIYLSPIIYTLAFIAILYNSYTILRLLDIKKIIAYSSIIHMNYVIIAIFTFDIYSLTGSYFTLISHAFISGGLFLLVGILYRRYFSRNILYFKGLANVMPIYSLLLFYFIISNMSLPTTSAFPGEFFMFVGLTKNSLFISLLLLLLLFFSTAYNILLFNKITFGNISIFLSKFKDISISEFFTLLPYILFNIVLGIKPSILINVCYLGLLKLYIF